MNTTAIPHRKVIRTWLTPYSERSTSKAIALVALDIALFFACLSGVALAPHWTLKLVAGCATGFIIGRLFIIGHDACHQSLTDSRKLNRWIGRLVFLPSLTPYSLWDTGHNVVHHGYTNLKQYDFVWRPRTLQEFQSLPRWAQTLERIYRSGWALWLYYLVEIWWQKLFFPNAEQMPAKRNIFLQDCLLVSTFAVAWIAGLSAVAVYTEQSIALLLITGFFLPFIFWNGLIGFVVYVHHTHPDIVWYADKSSWGQSQPFVSTTVHLKFERFLGLDWGALLHHIMEHTAHHVDMRIPLYNLRAAQKTLEDKLPGKIVIQTFSWSVYRDIARRCKLYDYDARHWLDFQGKPTSIAIAN